MEGLRIVSTMSVGVDTIDLKAAEARGVWVTNVPAAATEDVAVHTFGFALALVRRIPFLDVTSATGAGRLTPREPSAPERA